ncbi:MAG: hypothetical protein HDR11_10240 [Lachnospiraceae bacterium]|nr:hypothetical protein [Lachnospiraceae bacterium]
MKRTLLLITCFLLFLTGCGTAKTTSNTPSTEPVQSPEEPTSSTESAPQENLDFYIGQIVEFPVEVSGIRISWEKTYTLCMTEPSVLEVGDGFLTAKGILTNEILSTLEEVTVQYNFSEYEGVNLLTNSKCLTESSITFVPAEPFTIDFLYDNVNTIAIFPTPDSLDYVEYPLTKEAFVIELSEDGWKDYFTFNGTIIITDAEGNKYQTTIDHSFSYTIYDDYDARWKVQNDFITVKPIE